MISLDAKEITAEIRIVTKNIVITQRMVLFRSFLDELGSDLDNCPIPFMFNNNGSRQDKSYGLGRVVFHRTEPAVAAQAVPV